MAKNRITKPSKLEDVSSPKELKYEQIEPGIINLIKALRSTGFYTTGSCEGNINYLFDEINTPFPWIRLFSPQPLKDILEITTNKQTFKGE